MKTILAVLLIAMSINLYAQRPIDKLIATEKSFAATSKEQTTKIAFLAFLDRNCVGYRNGEQVNLFEEYQKQKEDSSKLTWAPEFAVIAASGELGATTGPWEYRQSSLKDTPVAHGHFTTIWKKNDKEDWKAVFDIGIGYAQEQNNHQQVTELILTNNKAGEKETSTLARLDLNFSDAFEADKKYAVGKVITNDSWLSIQGNAPLKGSSAINAFLSSYTDNIKFSLPEHSVFSKSMDMFAMYGRAQTGNTKRAYVRLWIKQGDEWKLLMMVIQ